MKAVTFLAAAAAIATVSAQATDEGRLYYSEPTGATVWTAGQTHTISWTNQCKPENTGDLNIVLYIGTGGNNGTEQVRVPNINAIGVLNCVKSKSATVTLPANLTTSNKYAIHVDTEPLQSYSAAFSIKGIDPPVTATTPAAGATTSAAAGASSTPAGATAPATGASTSAPAGASPTNAADKPSGAGAIKAFGAATAVVAAAVGSLFF